MVPIIFIHPREGNSEPRLCVLMWRHETPTCSLLKAPVWRADASGADMSFPQR